MIPNLSEKSQILHSVSAVICKIEDRIYCPHLGQGSREWEAVFLVAGRVVALEKGTLRDKESSGNLLQ